MARNRVNPAPSDNAEEPIENTEEITSNKTKKTKKTATKEPKTKKAKKPKKSNKASKKQSKPETDTPKKPSSFSKAKSGVKKAYDTSPKVIQWLKNTTNNTLGVLEDVSKGSHHYILTKQLLMAGSAVVVVFVGLSLSNGKYQANLRESSYNQTLFSNKGSLQFTQSGTSVQSSKVYKSQDGKTVYIPVTFSNGSLAQMPMNADQMSTKVRYAGSVIDSSKLTAEMVGYPALDNEYLYIYVIHKPDDKYTNTSSTFTTTVDDNLTVDTTSSSSSSKYEDAKDTLSFTVDLGASNITKMGSNTDEDNLKEIYAKSVYNSNVNDLVKSSKESLNTNKNLYNQASALSDSLTKSNVRVPATPKYALEQNDGNIYNVDYSSNIIKGFFPESSYGTLKSQYLGSGYNQNTDVFNTGVDALSASPTYTNNTEVPASDKGVLSTYSSLTSAWQSIISNKQSAYVGDAQQLFSLQYQFDYNLTQKTTADNSNFDISAKKNN